MHEYTMQIKEYIKKNTNKFIYNVPYKPEYNPIEKVFSELKRYIKIK